MRSLRHQKSFSLYSTYKDSGGDWFGIVPDHWEVQRLKRVFAVVNGSTPSSGEPDFWDGNIPWATPDDLGALEANTIHKTKRYITQAGYMSCGTVLVPKKSLLLSTRAPIGHVAIAAEAICTNQGCKSLVQHQAGNTTYFYYQLKAAVQELVSFGRGSTYMELASDKLEYLQIAIPPSSEREFICDFLDRETANIDALIAKKERLIELLNEKRVALITRSVTRGLDTTVPMKDSGIEWLGEIPVVWHMSPLGHVLERITYGFTNPMPVVPSGPYMLTANDVGEGRIRYETARCTSEAAFNESLTDKSRPVLGDILVTKDGTLGRVAVSDGQQACINQSVALLRPDQSRVCPEFLANVLREGPYHDRMLFEAGGTTIRHIYVSRLAKMPIVFPSLTEQQTIASLLDKQCTKIEAAISKIHAGLRLLYEYRTSLISAAVTGKIDVRKEVA